MIRLLIAGAMSIALSIGCTQSGLFTPNKNSKRRDRSSRYSVTEPGRRNAEEEPRELALIGKAVGDEESSTQPISKKASKWLFFVHATVENETSYSKDFV